MTNATYVDSNQVVSYHPLAGLRLREAICPMDFSPLGSPGELLCGLPATVQVVYLEDSKPYWAEWWCPAHAALFVDEDAPLFTPPHVEAAWSERSREIWRTQEPGDL